MALNRAAGFIRRQIGARIRLRHTPELSFAYDESVEQRRPDDAVVRGDQKGDQPEPESLQSLMLE